MHRGSDESSHQSPLPPVLAADLIATAAVPVVAVDPTGRILLWNAGAELLFGCRADDARGRDLVELVADTTQRPAWRELLRQARDTGSTLDELECIHHDGSLLRVEATFRLIDLGLIAVAMRDKTEQQRLASVVLDQACKLQDAMAEICRLESKVREQKEQLSHHHGILSELTARVAHNLRNPLAAIQGSIQYVKRKIAKGAQLQNDGRVAELLTVIDFEFARTSRIIDDLQTFARLQAPEMRDWSLRALVDGAIQSLRTPSGIQIDNRISHDIPILRADGPQLKRVIANLLVNAIQACERKKQGSISVGAHLSAGTVHITVEDGGEGISAEELPNVFEPLYTTRLNGSGLGLAIVRQIIEQHGGKVSIASTHGQGTAATVALPLWAGIRTIGPRSAE